MSELNFVIRFETNLKALLYNLFHSDSFENPIFGTCEACFNCDFQP